MDLNAVRAYGPATMITGADGTADEGPWRDGDAWLGGGTWLFSEPQPRVRRLLDLSAFGWPPLTESAEGLSIAATCTLAELARWRPVHPGYARAATLARRCCQALLGSFKVHNVATVGGNICLSLPAGPMTALTAALDGVATLASPASGGNSGNAGGAARRVAVADFITGDTRNVLRPGELLTRVEIPAAMLAARTAFRQYSLSPAGRSAVLVIARRDPDGSTVVTVTASTPRPLTLRLPGPADPAAAVAALAAAAPAYLDDVYGSGRWRAAMTRRAVREVTAELTPEGAEAGPGQ